jgi:hypothetical protein
LERPYLGVMALFERYDMLKDTQNHITVANTNPSVVSRMLMMRLARKSHAISVHGIFRDE